MFKTWSRAFLLLVVLTVLTGVAYPLAVTGLAQVVFPHQANGSIVYRNGQPVGSNLIGQNFSAARYFHGRPSAAGKSGYDASNSAGSNLGPTNKTLIANVSKQIDQVRKENSLAAGTPVPSDLVTASASGLDPDITPAAALIQVARVAQARSLPEEKVRSLVGRYTAGPQLGFLGDSRVNVLKLNMALDAI